MMLQLAFAVDTGDTAPYTNDCPTATKLYGVIKANLVTVNQKCGTSWTIVWGPAIFSFPVNVAGRHIDNVIFVARDGATNNYVMAIAGTDPESIDDWVFEDFIVCTTVPWVFDINPFGPRPHISLATFNGLTILLNITPACAPIPGTGMKLTTFLATLTGSPINLYTTGHSLGGALAPALTLALDNLRPLWDLSGNATFHPFAFAGPTPGDAAFAAYFNQKFPQGLQRVWNALDVVPHAWDTPHLKELPSLYGPPIQDVTNAVNLLVAGIGGIGYTPLNNQPATFSGPQQNPKIITIDAYFNEAVWQHTTAYAKWAANCK
jgi:hypothetical protein